MDVLQGLPKMIYSRTGVERVRVGRDSLIDHIPQMHVTICGRGVDIWNVSQQSVYSGVFMLTETPRGPTDFFRGETLRRSNVVFVG